MAVARYQIGPRTAATPLGNAVVIGGDLVMAQAQLAHPGLPG
jgi:hypothetical protein